jgi:hypothetical protein
MNGFLVYVTKTEENGGSIVAKWDDHRDFYRDLLTLEGKGKALCTYNGGGYPFKYTAKTADVMPLIKKALDERLAYNKLVGIEGDGTFWMMGYGVVPDMPVATTNSTAEILACSADETLLLELWDLS